MELLLVFFLLLSCYVSLVLFFFQIEYYKKLSNIIFVFIVDMDEDL